MRKASRERTMLTTLVEMVVCGVSIRRVTQITQELCGKEFSKPNVSRYAQELDELVDTWRNRRTRRGLRDHRQVSGYARISRVEGLYILRLEDVDLHVASNAVAEAHVEVLQVSDAQDLEVLKRIVVADRIEVVPHFLS